MTAVVTFHGADPARPAMFKVIVRQGGIVQHHAGLSAGEYAALLASPSLSRPSVVGATPPDIMAELMCK